MCVFPAHAGMNRLHGLMVSGFRSVPRTRGDEPEKRIIIGSNDYVFPAHAGMNR